ncbi:MAG: beta-ketoacyl-ACP synthase III [Candidatus Polarisedimenticolia bacterium]
MGAKILGIGAAVPSKLLTNADLEKMVDTSDEWIVTRTGIHERHIAPPGVEGSDLAGIAARQALEAAGVPPEEIDILIVATATPETLFPTTSCWAHPKIGLPQIPCFDIGAGCSGFIYAYIVANSLVASGAARKMLVVGAEMLTRVTDWEDRNTCVLFGDGAGAIVLGPGAADDGLIASTWGADGSLANLLIQPAGGTKLQASHETVEKRLHTVHMAGNEVFRYAVKAMQQATLDVMEQAGVTADDIALFIPHQANLRIIKATAERAKFPMEKVYVSIGRYGNTSSASIPTALRDAYAEGRVKKGDLVLSAAFGAGLTWAAALFRI